MLILASQRIESVISSYITGWGDTDPYTESNTKRGAPPTLVEWLILSWVSGK